MNKDNIYNIINSFNNQIIGLVDNLESQIKEANKKLFNDELQKLIDEYDKKILDIFANLCGCNSKNTTSIEKIMSKKPIGENSHEQISNEEFTNLNNLQNELQKYIMNYSIKLNNKKEILTVIKLDYDFTEIKDKQYDLFYNSKKILINTETHKGFIYIIKNDKEKEQFEARFELKISQIEKPMEDNKNTDDTVEGKLNEEDKKSESKDNSIDNVILNEEKEKNNNDDIDDVKKYINFQNINSINYQMYEINKEEEIKESIKNKIQKPDKNSVTDPPVILLLNYKLEEFSNHMKELMNKSDSLFNKLKEIKKNKINFQLRDYFETDLNELIKLVKQTQEMLKLNRTEFEDLNNSSKELEKEISEFNKNLTKFYDNYNNSLKNKMDECFRMRNKNLFNLDFSLPDIPKTKTRSYISLNKMNTNSENLCVPIISIDSEGKNLICCYKSLELNLGKTCPALYYRPYIINIISFVNEDMRIKIKNYNENIGGKKTKKEEKKEDEEPQDENQNEGNPLRMYGDENDNQYLTVNEYIKKGDNIELFLETPQSFEEETIQIEAVLNIETISGKKLDLNVKFILTTMPISVIISCKEFELIKETPKNDSNAIFEHCFRLNATKLSENQEIHFELSNQKNEEELIEFYLSVESLENNTSTMPIFSNSKLTNKFSITIPSNDYDSNDNDISIIHCIFEIFVNKNFIIYIIIDSFIKPCINILKIYDFYTQSYVEKEMNIYLNESSQEIFKSNKHSIELRCILFSTLENEEFTVTPESFLGGKIIQKKDIIKNGKCEFSLLLQFDEAPDKIIKSGNCCIINISTNNINKIEFKIKFCCPSDNVFSDEYYINYKIKGKNKSNDEWKYLNKCEKTKFYVTPFERSLDEIHYKDISEPIKDLKFYFIDIKGNISSSNIYEKQLFEHNYISQNKDKYPFSLRYKDLWFPLIKINRKFPYHPLQFFNSEDIQAIYIESKKDWKKKFAHYKNAYSEIKELESKFFDYYLFTKSEKVIKKNISILIKEYRDNLENNKTRDDTQEIIVFEDLAYIVFKNYNCIKDLHQIFPEIIKAKLLNYFCDFFSENKEKKELALYNYLLTLQNIFAEKAEEFDKIIKIDSPDFLKQQKTLLLEYYSIKEMMNPENVPSILTNYKNQIQLFEKQQNINDNTSSNQYLIIGNQSDSYEFNPRSSIYYQPANDVIPKFDISINMLLPEVTLDKYKENLSLNKYLELYNSLIIGTRVLPGYLLNAIKNKIGENIKKANDYFESLYSIYFKIKDIKNNHSLIYEEINSFIKSFTDMIMKLKNAGIDFSRNDYLKAINHEIDTKNSYITPPKKIEPEKKKNKWENQKKMEQNIEQDFNKEYMKSITGFNDLKSIQINSINTEMSNRNKQNEENSSENMSKTNIEKFEDDNQGDMKIDDTLSDYMNILNEIQDDDMILSEEEQENKVEKKEIPFSPVNIQNEKLFSKISREKFENIENKFKEDYAFKYIVDKMKNKINETDKFKYESLSEIKGYNPDKRNLNLIIGNKKGEQLPILKIIENSRFLTSKIYSAVAQINYDNINDKNEILFDKLEANILVDLARTISNENRYLNMLIVCGLTSALNIFGIKYTLSLIGDSNCRVMLKKLDEPHSELMLQKLYDCCYIKRNVTQLATCLRYFLDNYPPENETKNRIYYIFTNGFDEEIKKCKSWKDKIFNDIKNSFAFIFAKSKVLEKNSNIHYKKYLENVWKRFSEESQNSNSYVTLSQISFNDIDKLDELVENLSKVMLREKTPKNKDSMKKEKALFNLDKSSILTPEYINSIRSLLTDQFNKAGLNELYIKRNKIPFIYDNEKDDQKYFKTFCQRTGKIIRYDKLNIETQKNILHLVKEFKEKKEKIKLGPLNIIFKPNLPTQSILVEEGTHLDITELIKYSINKVPNPRLYREIKDGFVKNYGVSIVLDTSTSCLNELCIFHTIQTLRILLSTLACDNIPCLDIIISRAKEPIILCSEKSANEILSDKSPFWAVLFSCLEGEPHSDLASAIKAAYNLNRARRVDYTNYIFVLTDGLYSSSQREKIIGISNNCYSKNINLFGIGVGIYPIGIEQLFTQAIYSQNPYKLIEGIASFFGDISKYKDISMKSLIIQPNIEKISENRDKIKDHINNPKYKELKDEITNKIKFSLESFPFFNPELERNNDGSNPDGENSGMWERNFYLGQKILFAMFFSSDLKTQGGEATTEDEKKIHPNYVTNKIKNEECISSVLEYYGYKVIVVTNYEQAIIELCKKNNENKAEYNSLWVISGQEVPDIPSNNGNPNAPYYVEQFVDCALEFWKNGGSLVLMGENDPHNFQVNLFLKKMVFPDGTKLKFKIGGNHKGRKILRADDSGKLEEKQTFNSKIQEVNNFERKSLANNLVKIFEGATVAYAQGDISPFIKFSRDSDGGINSLFYCGQDRGDGKGEGDIFIDCGYTKFFMNMKECGTSRYLQNIGGFIGSAERRSNMGCDPKLYRPEGVNFILDKNPRLHYKYPTRSFDVVYLVDATASMMGSIENVKNYCVEIANILKNQAVLFDFKFGAVFYRDPIDCPNSDKNELYDLTSNMKDLQNFVGSIKADGGGDDDEDWAGGYNLALNSMSWREGRKLIIHIADAGAHGYQYSDNFNYQDQGPLLDMYIKECQKRNIFIVSFQIGSSPQKSFQRIKMLYGNKNINIQNFDQNKKDSGYFTNLVVESIINVT